MLSHITSRRGASGLRFTAICGIVLGALLLGMPTPSAEAGHAAKGHAAAKGSGHHGHAKKGKNKHSRKHKKTKRQTAAARAAKKHRLANRTKGHRPHHPFHHPAGPSSWSYLSSWAGGPRVAPVLGSVVEPAVVVPPVRIVEEPVVVRERPFVITFVGVKGNTHTTEILASSESEAKRRFRADHPNAKFKSIVAK